MFAKQAINADWAMSKIGSLLTGFKTTAEQELGIELELEGMGTNQYSLVTQMNCKKIQVNEDYSAPNPQANSDAKWDWHKDGTLQEGLSGEFVLSEPLERAAAKKAVFSLFSDLTTHGKVQNSNRCSTHVHLNFQHMNVNQVFLYLTLYYIFEECFFKVYAPEREGNQFCLPAYLAGGIVDNHMKNLMTNSFNYGMHKSEKYAAMNFASLSYHGTLEARLMGGLDNPEKLSSWIDVLMEMYDYVKNNPKLTPEYFLNQFSGMAFMIFTEMELPTIYQLIKDLPNVGKMVSNGVFIAQDIAMAVDWTPVITASEPVISKKTVKKPLYATGGHPDNMVWYDEAPTPTAGWTTLSQIAIDNAIVNNQVQPAW